MTGTTVQETRQFGRVGSRPSSTTQNVGELERWLSVLGGGLLGTYGLSRVSLPGLALAGLGAAFVYRGVTGHCPCYAALGISTAERHGPATSVPAGKGVKVEKSITINRRPEDLYRYWRRLETLPRFMQHIESVTSLGDRSHWVAKGPLGKRLEWDAEVIMDRADELISWRSLPGSDVDSAGSVHFQSLGPDRGTRVTVTLKYDPPAGKVGKVIAQLLGQNPEKQIEEDLRRFKQLMEAGELAMGGRQSLAGNSWNRG
jgi:uncharacterized membrane protein